MRRKGKYTHMLISRQHLNYRTRKTSGQSYLPGGANVHPRTSWAHTSLPPNENGTLVGSAVFVVPTVVTNTQMTNRSRCSDNSIVRDAAQKYTLCLCRADILTAARVG